MPSNIFVLKVVSDCDSCISQAIHSLGCKIGTMSERVVQKFQQKQVQGLRA